MTLNTVAADDPIEASLQNQLIAKVNSSPGAAVFTSSGTWVVPAGVHKFRVSLCGGGGAAGAAGSTGSPDFDATPGGPGGDGGARRIWVSGVDLGSSFAVTVGAAGSASAFGSLLTVAGGGVGGSDSLIQGVPGSKGTYGGVTGGTMSGTSLGIGNEALAIWGAPHGIPQAYGQGGPLQGDAGAPGIVIVEW